jgi:hypothetical protein
MTQKFKSGVVVLWGPSKDDVGLKTCWSYLVINPKLIIQFTTNTISRLDTKISNLENWSLEDQEYRKIAFV